MILYGATIRNGKGILCESILKVFGLYGITSRPETISLQNQSSSGPSEDLARLVGIRYVNISEPKKGFVLNAALLKSMTGNDSINARFLHENSFDFSPQFKLFINTNYLPVVTYMTVFSSGRLIIIPLDRHFSGNELESAKQRIEKLDAIIKNLYEDNLEGKLLDQRFEKLTKSYDDEETTLNARIKELEKEINESNEKELNVDSFLKLVRKYTDIQELDPEIIRVFVDKIYVDQSEKIPGSRLKKQTVWIHTLELYRESRDMKNRHKGLILHAD